ncbi:MAG: 4-hydroxyphenylpyruvate dioxygenase [Candidatus Dormibacteraeota bacterium]|nr:4-hydroxyphenylpyruvate dioxygenase [Candidatus Dormibacteraeota bacterium]MBV9526443.1 4-hydroxyphenylpyruvate dioxygenase [Candidatus Dormibacteraeota bacterium]
MAATVTEPSQLEAPVLSGTDHVELYVGNARQAAYHYRNAFGFDVIAYAGPETGVRDRASYVLQQGKVRLVLTAPLQPEGAIAEHVALHGDGVKSIALRTADAAAAYRAATARGARGVQEPARVEDEHGVLTFASVATYGDTVHTFVERDEYAGVHWPGYREDARVGGGVGLRFIDHTVGNVEKGRMDDWVSFYSEVFGFNVFQEFDEKDIATQYSALRSKVTRDPNTMITFPINEPYVGIKRSQIQEYLDYYRGSGVQHIALHTDDIVSTIGDMKQRGVEFLTAPDAYYDALGPRADGIDEDLDRLRALNILLDRDDDGYLLQIFTRPVADRPTLFFEVIQRKGCKGFGKGNFKALFEAIEREQAARGNL